MTLAEQSFLLFAVVLLLCAFGIWAFAIVEKWRGENAPKIESVIEPPPETRDRAPRR